ncbi:YejL family protein [Avibacterium paragallinarum]|uniref:YejL family protein n=1 Tax=Avibacterium paragallinarum TaxID=728 RepID=UPI003978E68C
MAKQSKFQNQQIDTLLNDLIAVFEKHQAPVDLSLVVLGNMVTNVLTNSVGQQQRIALAQAFSDALMNSVKEKKA